MKQLGNYYFAIIICCLFSSISSYGQNAPVATNDIFTSIQDVPINDNVLLNDTDPDGNTLTISTTPISQTFNGSLVLNWNGSFTYTPNPGHTGYDFFQYQVCDNGTPSLCDTGFVQVNTGPLPSSLTVDTIHVNVPRNQQNYIKFYHDEFLGFSIGITDLNCQSLNHGSNLGVIATGIGSVMSTTFIYLSGTTSGTDTLCILATDYDFGTVDTTIFIISVINNPPNAIDDNYTTTLNTSVNGNILDNDFDIHGDSIYILTTPITNPSNGTMVINPDGSLTYMPNVGFIGMDTSTYQICDVNTPSLCDTATIYFNITNDCNFLPDTLSVTYSVACNDSIDVCLPFTRGDTAFSVLVDGQSYSTYSTGKDISNNACHFDSLIIFDLSHIQSSGPWIVSYSKYPFYTYTHSQTLFSIKEGSGLVNNLNDLVDSLNVWDISSFPWILNSNNTISTRRRDSGLLQFTDINTNVVSSIEAKVEFLTTTIRIPVTAQEVRIVGDTCMEIMVVDIECKVGIDSLTITDASSCTIADGTITVHANYGSGNYEYSLNNNDVGVSTGWQSSPVFTGLQSHDDYIVSIKDITENKYDAISNIEIKGADEPVINGISHTTNTIAIHATGSALPLEYRIIPNPYVNISYQNSNQFSPYGEGEYNVLVRYNNGLCEVETGYIDIVNNTGLAISNVTASNSTDCNASNGNISVTATITSTNTVYYSIDSGQTWQTNHYFPNLSNGSYHIAVKAGLDTIFYTNNPVLITEPVSPVINNVAFSHPTGCGLNDGTITITASGGSGNLEYSINCGSSWVSSNVFTGLSGGSYCIHVRNDDGSCFVESLPITLNAPPSPVITNVAYTNPTDCGVADGAITITASSDTTLNYSIDGGATFQASSTFTGLVGGTYSVVVRYFTGTCETAPQIVSLVDKVMPVINNVTATNPSNCGIDDASITISATGSFIEYSVDGGVNWEISNIFTGLGAGCYTVVVRNADGSCLVYDPNNPFCLVAPASPTVTSVNTTDPTTCASSDGTITIMASGGIGSYEYSISGITTWQSSNTFTGLASGSYFIQVRNSNGTCSATNPPVTLHSPTSPIITNISSTNPTGCDLSDGKITIIANGNAALEYSIDGGTTFQASNTFTGLVNGFYQIVIRYNNGTCAVMHTPNTVLTSPVVPQINNVNFTNPTNCTTPNGSIIISASSGITPLEYSINGGLNWQTSNVFTGLNGGIYQVVSRYQNGTCLVTYPVSTVLTNLTPPQINNVSFTNPTNCTTPNGSIIISASSGITPLGYSINGGVDWFANGGNFTGLLCGNYDIWVRNINGTCPINYGSLSLNVPNQAPLAINDNYITNINTPITENIITNDSDPDGDNLIVNTMPIINSSNGTVTILPNGGIQYTPNLHYVGQDTFSYQICDDGVPSLCDTAMVYINITSSPLQIVNVSNTNESCSQGNGYIDISASDGTGIYEYSIDSQQTWQSSSYFGNLSAGVYHAFVRDGLDTVAYISNPITIFDTLAPVIVSTNYNYDTLTINATATQPMQYSINCGATWQNSNVFYPVSGTNICVGVRISSGSCPVFTNVNNNPPISVADTITFPQGGYQTLNVIQNDYDLENNSFLAVPQTTYYGVDSLTLDANGIMTVPTDAWSFGSYLIPYQVCEVNNPSNCSQSAAYITITPPTQVYYDTMAIGATHVFCIPNSLPGTPISGTLVSNFMNNIIDSITTNCLHIYGNNYGVDTAIIVVCDNLGFCDTTHLYLNVIDGVWPGDTDDDTYVDNFDLLNIGLGYGQTGTSRNVITNVWNGYVTPLWNTATPNTNIDYRHADSDGDGIVGSLDTIAIIQNYGSNYQRGGTSVLGGIPIQIGNNPANVFPKYSLPILFGDALNPVSNLYGGAFSISYDTTIIKVDSIYITFDTTWVGTKDVDMITIQKNLPNNSQIDAAFTRIDGNNVNGFGIIGRLNFTIKDDILQRPSFGTDSIWAQFHIFDTKFISNDESLIGVDELSSDILITSLNKVQPIINHLVQVFPNPAKDFVNISTQNLNVKHISISDMTGKTILIEKGNYSSLQQIDISILSNGVYNVLVQTDKGIAVKRLTILK